MLPSKSGQVDKVCAAVRSSADKASATSDSDDGRFLWNAFERVDGASRLAAVMFTLYLPIETKRTIAATMDDETTPTSGDLDGDDDAIDEFTIPELPVGRVLRVELLAPWADARYMGLNAIEMFGADGARPQIEAVSIRSVES